MFTVVKILNSTIREEEVDGPEYGVFNFCVYVNYDISMLYFQNLFLNNLSFGQNLRTIEDVNLTSIHLLSVFNSDLCV